MASELPYDVIAQQCSVLASFIFTVLFIADAAPRAAGEVMTFHHVAMGFVACASLKAMTLLFLTHDVFVVCASMMPEPRRSGHMATVTPSISGQVVVFWVARASLTTVDP
jgi:hypothetical protein